MQSETGRLDDIRVGTPRRRLMVGGALTLLLAGSLALSTPAFAQESEEDGEVTEETTVSTDDSDGTAVEIGDSGEGEEDDSAGVGASGTTAAAVPAAAVPAAAAPTTASGAAAPTTLPSTGVGGVVDASLALIALAAAGAVAAGAVAVNGARRAEERI